MEFKILIAGLYYNVIKWAVNNVRLFVWKKARRTLSLCIVGIETLSEEVNSTPLLFIHQTACDRRGRGYVRRRHWSGGRRATMVAVTSRSAVRPAPESDTASWIPGPHFTAAHALPFLLTLIPSQNFPSEKLKHREITSLLSGAEKQ